MKSERDYQAEDDHRTISRAEEIRADRGRMAGVKKHHRKVSKAHAMVQRSFTGRR